MKPLKTLLLLITLLTSAKIVPAQIEVAHASTKDFSAVGFCGFLNLSIPVSEANYLTIEGGIQSFKDKNTNQLTLIPVLAGFRYTLDQSGSGFFVEPFAGYAFGESDLDQPDGIAGGVGLGYLVDLGNVPFNFALRYERIFGNPSTNVIGFRIAHSLGFGRRNDDY